MRLLFLVEAGETVGMGHLMRSRALLFEAQRRGWETEFWVAGGDRALVTWLFGSSAKASVFPRNSEPGWLEAHAAECAAAATYDWIILDGYGFTGEVLTRRQVPGRPRVLAIDDFGNAALSADIVLNPNTDDASLYPGRCADRLLLGPAFALIGPEFRDATERIALAPDACRILISFGSADPSGALRAVLECLAGYARHLEIHAVIGPFAPLQTETIESPRHDVIVHRSPLSLAPLMRHVDLVISSASVTAWETCSVGLPLIAVETADNQRFVTRTLAAAGAALCLHVASLFDSSGGRPSFLAQFDRAMRLEVRRALVKNARELVDGRGVSRVLATLNAAMSQRRNRAAPLPPAEHRRPESRGKQCS